MTSYEALAAALDASVRDLVLGKDVAVAFSGGMDSGLISALAKKYARSVVLYTCGTDDAFDVAAGRELSETIGLTWKQARISEDGIEDRIKEFIIATGVSDPFTISYEMQLFSVCKEVGRNGPVIVLSGQGSDEYFNGCASSVSESEEDFEKVRQWGIERMQKVSTPCEQKIAKYFGKKIVYPYMDRRVVDEVYRIPMEELRPSDLAERKMVLKRTCELLGFPYLAHRTKKASQYGSNTTEIIRARAKARGLRYNRYIASLYAEVGPEPTYGYSQSALNIRVDPALQYDAEAVLEELGITPSDAVSKLYSRLIRDGNLDFLE